MFDTHAHLNFPDFKNDLDEVLGRSFEKNIKGIIVTSSNIDSSRESLKISKTHDRLYASCGIHPEDIEEDSQFSEIIKLASDSRVVAIGETGLDYSRISDLELQIKERQASLLKKHIDLAKKVAKPLIFHNRDSNEDFLRAVNKLDHIAVLHCFTGNWEFAEKILDLGFMISFTGIITFTKDNDLLEVVRKIPIERVMVETDCPFLAPSLYRGKRAEPWMVEEVVKKIAEIKKISFEEVEEITDSNAKIFFSI